MKIPWISSVQFSSVTQSCPTLCDLMDCSTPLPPCPSPTPGVYPNPYPLSRWCHPTISSSVIPFSSRPQCFPASVSFPMSQLFSSGGQSIGVSASKISPSNEHPGLISFRMDWLEKPNLTERASLKCTVVSVKCSKLYLDTFNWGLCDNAAALPGRWEASRLQCNPSGLATRRCSSSAQRSPYSDLQMTPCLWQKAKKN